MRLTTFFILAAVLQVSAKGYSQEKVSVNFENVRLDRALKEVERKSTFHFVYSNLILTDKSRVSFVAKDISVAELLERLLQNTGLTFSVMDNNLVVIKKEGEIIKDVHVKGKVTDKSTGQPLEGVSIQVKGSDAGTSTDTNGNYSIEVPDDATLVVSSVGYTEVEIPVNGREEINIALQSSTSGLNEVVVVGYEQQRRKDLTGAISTISAKDLVMSSAPDIGHMLEGKIPGLYIQQNSAQPGGGLDLLIRGGGSINASNAPLIVLDGFPISDVQQPGTGGIYNGGTFSMLNSLNPNDVESITVLKDASATAIYGSRAANGVILITTKTGSSGKPIVHYSSDASVQPYVNKFKELSLSQWMQVYNDAAWENWLWTNQVQPWGPNSIEDAQAYPVAGQYSPYFSQKAIDNVGDGTDWVGLVTRTGSTIQHNLSISGGSNSVKYFLSGNYYDQKGVVKNSELKRISFRSNFDIKLSKILTLSTSLSESRINNNNTQLGDAPYEQSGILTAALQQGPQIRAKDENGNYPVNPLEATQPNPLGLLTITDLGKIEKTLFNTFLLIHPTEHLNIKLGGGLERSMADRGNYVPTTTVTGSEQNGIANIAATEDNHYLVQATADYKKTFAGVHSLDVLLGASDEKFIDDGTSENVSNFISDAFLMYNMGAGTGAKTVGSSHGENEIASYFGRLNYRYNDKYYFTFTMRADGSSVFAPGHKWGYFPSAAVAWDITRENFFKPLSNNISQLKLRLSYGQTGNASIGTNAYAAYAAYPAYLSGDDQILIGVAPDKLENPDLTWETTTEANIGIDYSILGDRVSGSLDFYNKIISNLLATEQLDSYQTISSVTGNIGETQSKGFGLSINTVNIKRKDFSWRTILSVSRFYNTWKQRGPNWKPAVYQNIKDPIDARYTLLSGGILQTGQKTPTAQPLLVPGQIIINDINGYVRDANGNPEVDANGRFELTGKPDGKIDDADYVLDGTTDPSYTGGIVNILSYKNFTLNISFNAMFGRRMEDPNFMLRGRNAYQIFQSGSNDLTSVLNRWTPTNPSTTQPSTYQDWSPYGNGDFFLQKAWFIRLQDISLEYNLPSKWFRGVFNQAGIHVAANNLLLITPYKGVDPETDSYAAAYPNMSTYTFGINFQF